MYVSLSDVHSALFSPQLAEAVVLYIPRNDMWRVFEQAIYLLTHPVAELCDYAHAQCRVECHHRTVNADIHMIVYTSQQLS